jgi:alpha-tubulin suppressor-like RCC1 family protein
LFILGETTAEVNWDTASKRKWICTIVCVLGSKINFSHNNFYCRYESSPMPKLVGGSLGKDSARQLKHVRSICAGDHHSACLVEPGFVYTWGRGQVLGRESVDPNPNTAGANSNANDATSPMGGRRGSSSSLLQFTRGRSMSTASSIMAMESYYRPNSTANLPGVKQNSFYSSSSFNYGTGAPAVEQDSCQPGLVAVFNRRRVQQLCSGEGHLVVRVGADLYAWGDNKLGQVCYICAC